MEDDNKTPAENIENINNINPPPEDMALPRPSARATSGTSSDDDEPSMEERLERLGGEPAPVITPEEFARLQKAGQVHIDARGRVRTTGPSGSDAGVSLHKRRAWYG